MAELSDKLKEHFPRFFSKGDSIKIEGNFVTIQRGGRNISSYAFSVANDTLTIGGSVGGPIEDMDSVIRGILRLNETAAREAGFFQIIYNATSEYTRQLAEGESYIF